MKATMNRHKGLTLIEILVVIFVASILFITLYTVFKSGAEAWSKARMRLEIYQNARVIMEQLSRELPGAFVDSDSSATFTGEDGDTDPENDASPDKLEFITNFAGTIYKLKYELKPGDSHILLREYIKEPTDYASTDYEFVEFGFSVNKFDFLYWDTITRDWTKDGTWAGSKYTLPGAVKIKLELIDTEGKTYPFETTVYIPSY